MNHNHKFISTKSTTPSESRLPHKPTSKRIGIAEGIFKTPSEFAFWDKDLEFLFEADIYEKVKVE